MEKVVRIAGGGLAGLSLGIALRKRGVPVELHEAGKYPRHRVCGEFISGVSDSTLQLLGIEKALASSQRLSSVLWCRGEEKLLTSHLPTPAFGVSRHVLDARLRDDFVALGGAVHENSRLQEVSGEGWVRCTGRLPARGKWIGLKSHFCGLSMDHDLEMHLAGNGYIGLARVDQDLVNVCGLFRVASSGSGEKGVRVLLSHIEAGGLHSLSGRLRQGHAVEGSFLGVAGFRLGRQPAPEGDALSVGDTWGMIPPFTGNGMSMAFESAAVALGPVVSWFNGATTWPDSQSQLRHGLKKRFGRRMMLAQGIHPFLTSGFGQAFLSVLVRSGLLPFQFILRGLR